MKTPEELIEELKESVRMDRAYIKQRNAEIKMLKSTVDAQNKWTHEILTALGVEEMDPETTVEEFQAIVIATAQEAAKWREHLDEERDKDKEIKALQVELARLTVGGMNLDYEIKVTNLKVENDYLRQALKETECSRGLFRLNYEQQTKEIDALKAKIKVLEDRMSVKPSPKYYTESLYYTEIPPPYEKP